MQGFRINKISLFLLSLAGAGFANAGTMGDISAAGSDKHFFATVTPLYGSINDGGINENPLADTISATGAVTTIAPKFNNNWGFAVGLGYRYGADKNNALVLNYMNLSANGTTNTSVGTDGQLIDRMGILVESGFGGKTNTLIGPATASVKTNNQYQTGELISQRWFQNKFINNVQFSRFWGVKATYFTKSLDAQYDGLLHGGQADEPMSNTMAYDAKYYAIGPKIGFGAQWNLSHIFSIGGDLSAAALGGSQNSSWNETLTTNAQTGISTPNLPQYTYNKTNNTSLWVAPMYAANLVASANFGMNSGSSLRLDAGIGFEAYLPDYDLSSFSFKNGANTVSISDHLAVRTVFLKFSYLS